MQFNTGSDVVVTGLAAQKFGKNLDFGASQNDKFANAGIIIRNALQTFATTLQGGAVTANRTLNLPATTGTDTLGALNMIEKWTANQTMQNPQTNGLDLNSTRKTSSYTATLLDDLINMDATSGQLTVTLPTVASSTGKIYTIQKDDASLNPIIIDASGSELIEGNATRRIIGFMDTFIIESNGTQWNIIKHPTPLQMVKGTTINRWHGTAVNQLASGTQATSINSLRVSPFIVEKTMRIDQIQFEVSTLATNSKNRVGIYQSSPTGYPTDLVANSDTQEFDASTATVKTGTFSTPIILYGGELYWLAYNTNESSTWRSIGVGSVPSVLGYTNTMGTSQAGTMWSVAQTYAALPTKYPSGATVLGNTVVQMILVREIG